VVFGAAYGAARQSLPEVSPVVLGPLYGSALYAVNIVGIAPLIGLTRGERQEPVGIRLQRLGIHVLFGIALAVFAELGGDRR
jgi:hypothetical protein